MKKLFIYGVCALMSLAAVSCHGDDPLYPNGSAPVITNPGNSISGTVTDQNGNPVNGATVKYGDKTTTTDANGRYVFEDVKPGEHTISVTAPGKDSAKHDVTVGQSDRAQNATASFTLYPTTTSSRILLSSADATVKRLDLTTVYTLSNNSAAVTIDVEAEPGTVDEDVEIWITPIYTDLTDDVSRTRAFYDEMLVGATLHSSKPVTLKKDIKITFNLDNSVLAVGDCRRNDAGRWTPISFDKTADDLIVKTREFKSFGVFAPVEVTKTTQKQNLVFGQSYWDNLNGANDMKLTSTPFTYYSGLIVNTTPANKLQALILEHLYHEYGCEKSTLTRNYELNRTLPVGYALYLYGQQEYYQISAKSTPANSIVRANLYGAAEVWNVVTDRDHDGGGSL